MAGFDRADEEARANSDGITDAAPGRRSATVRVAGPGGPPDRPGSQVERPRLLFEFCSRAIRRGPGALALASLGVMETVEGVVPVLERVATEPGAEGRLAQAYLKQLSIRRFKDTELRRAYAQRQELLTARGGELTPELRRLEALVEMVSRFHIEGDRVSRDELFEAAMQGLLQRMDPHSFFDSEPGEVRAGPRGGYGIGAYVNVDREDGLFPSPARSTRAPLSRAYGDDKIVRVGDWPTLGEASEEVIKRLEASPDPGEAMCSRMDRPHRPPRDMAVVVGVV